MLQVNGNEGFQRERMSSKEQDGYPFDFWLQVNLKHELPFRFNKNPSLGQPSFSPKNLCRSHASDTFPVRPQLLCASWKNQKYRAGHLFPEKIQGKSYNKSWISPNMTQEITQEGGKKKQPTVGNLFLTTMNKNRPFPLLPGITTKVQSLGQLEIQSINYRLRNGSNIFFSFTLGH